jgi:hypothetical protein
MRAWDEGVPLRELLADDGEAALQPDVLDRCFSAEYFLRNSGVVFDRLAKIPASGVDHAGIPA